jgi:hypothetical protein
VALSTHKANRIQLTKQSERAFKLPPDGLTDPCRYGVASQCSVKLFDGHWREIFRGCSKSFSPRQSLSNRENARWRRPPPLRLLASAKDRVVGEARPWRKRLRPRPVLACQFGAPPSPRPPSGEDA